ncbi:MAG: hypothetical protein WB812_00450 [Woeseiaceae bacterium]
MCTTALWAAAAADEPPVRDPTRPPYSLAPGSKQTGDRLRLVSTNISPSMRSAVIGDRVVGIGSRIGDAVVTSIDPGRVTLARGSDRIVLSLYPEAVKEASARDSR